MRIGPSVDIYLRAVKPLVCSATLRARRYHLESFVSVLGSDMLVKAVRQQHVVEWLGSMEVAASTLHVRFGTVKSWSKEMTRRRWVKEDPTHDIILPRRPRKRPRALTLEEARRLVDVLPDERARLIVSLAAMEGLRRSEIVELQLDDLDVASREITVVSAKTNGEEDVLPLSEFTVAALYRYLPIRGKGAGPLIRAYTHPGPLSLNHLHTMVSRWFADAGLKDAPFDGRSLHALRHTFAETVLSHSQDPTIVQAALRHRSLSSTWTYLRNRKSVEDLRPFMGQSIPEAS